MEERWMWAEEAGPVISVYLALAAQFRKTQSPSGLSFLIHKAEIMAPFLPPPSTKRRAR